MYFAQEYVPAGLILLFIAIRAFMLVSIPLALIGVVLPAIVIITATLTAAIWTRLQGIVLTAEALLFFIAMMLLMPRIWAAATEPSGRPRAAFAT